MSTTPYGDSPAGSDWSTASQAMNPARSSRQLVRQEKPSLSSLKQEILTEEEYTDAISEIIKRDFFGSLLELDANKRLARAVQGGTPSEIEESVRRMREIMTPTPRRRNLGATPGRTPFDSEPSDTPTYFSETPRETPTSSRSRRVAPSLRYDPTLSLDAFQSRYTSEDNSSFAELLQKDNVDRRKKHAWAWDAEKKANVKAIRGREARERLVEITRTMVENDPNGEVKMIEGSAGRPGERMLIVEGVDLPSAASERLMVQGSAASGRLMITSSAEAGETIDRKGKGRMVDYIDYEKEDDDAVPIGDPALHDQQVPVDLWKFTNRNSFMFPPDADVPFDRPHAQPDVEKDGPPLGEPKSIRYHATRLQQVASKGSKGSQASSSGRLSPTRSRINAAITGTPYPAAESSTPRVANFSFVDALPSPRAATISAEALQDLMTWGTIESTPVALRSSAATARSILGDGGGPFRITETSKRENLAHKMARKAKKSLGDRATSYGATPGGGLRRSVLDSTRGSRRSEIGSPRQQPSELSPAAQKLLGRTGSGRSMASGIAKTAGWGAEELRLERARARAREVESIEKMKRARWSPSPALSMGFDSDLPDVEDRLRRES